jgi:uncharacterized protein
MVRLIIADGGMEAFLISEGEKSDNVPSVEQVRSLLAEQGVVFGVQEDAVHEAPSMQPGIHKLVVARGKTPVSGKDGWTEYLFSQTSPPANASAEKKVDYHDLGWIHNVMKSSVVALIHPPEHGSEGMSVTGEPVSAKPGKQAGLKLGQGVMYDPDDPHRILAAEDGNASIDADGVLRVQPQLTINGNVDYATGDIDFVGSIRVMGDIKTNFTVKARKSIEVHGNVEDATLEAGEDVLIRNGFIGQGKGSIKAGGNVTVQHVLNQTITSGGCISIGREAMCATLQADDKITSPRGAFVGCVLQAGSEVEVHSLGNGDKTQAKVRVGKRAFLLDQISQMEKAIQKTQRQIEETKAAMYSLVRTQLDAGSLSPAQQELQKKLRLAQSELGKSAEAQLKSKEQLQVRLKENGLARIVVRDTMFANVFVELNGIRKMVQGAVKEVVLTERSGSIEEKPLE